ncbi:MAG: hypothetical protein AB1733_13270 [Thermodesulfobacteriota bacterium]
MKCARCDATVTETEAHDHHGEILCDDCYMNALSPVRTCDPWAVHSAKRLEAAGTQGLQLNEIQSRILDFLREVGEAEAPVICDRLQIDPETLKREFAALRHMEKARGKPKGDGTVLLCLW